MANKRYRQNIDINGPATPGLLVNGTKVVGAQQTLTITPTSGSLPTPNGAVTIADTTTPTVVELLEYCHELRAVLRTHGLVA